MNTKPTLFTLLIGSVVCLIAFAVQADSFRNLADKHQKSTWQNQQGEDDKDKTQGSGKDRTDKAGREKYRQKIQQQEQPRREKTYPNRDNERKWESQKLRPADRRRQSLSL